MTLEEKDAIRSLTNTIDKIIRPLNCSFVMIVAPNEPYEDEHIKEYDATMVGTLEISIAMTYFESLLAAYRDEKYEMVFDDPVH